MHPAADGQKLPHDLHLMSIMHPTQLVHRWWKLDRCAEVSTGLKKVAPVLLPSADCRFSRHLTGNVSESRLPDTLPTYQGPDRTPQQADLQYSSTPMLGPGTRLAASRYAAMSS